MPRLGVGALPLQSLPLLTNSIQLRSFFKTIKRSA
jgi:hypothetical protein